MNYGARGCLQAGLGSVDAPRLGQDGSYLNLACSTEFLVTLVSWFSAFHSMQKTKGSAGVEEDTAVLGVGIVGVPIVSRALRPRPSE